MIFSKLRLESTDKVGLGVLGFLLVVCLIVTVPWRPTVFDGSDIIRLGADLSGILGGIWGIENGKLWGEDITFPHGPMFFLNFSLYFPPVYGLLMFGSIVVAVGLAFGFWGLIESIESEKPSLIARVAAAAAVAVALTWTARTELDPKHSVLFLLMNLNHFIRDRDRPNVATAVVTFAAAAIALGKFPFLLLFALNIALMVVSDVVLRRRFPVVGAVGTASLAFWWFLGGQSVSNFISYLTTSFAIADGYNDAMGIGYLDRQRAIHVASLLAAIGVLVVVQISAFGRYARRSEGILSLLGLGAVYFAHFKHGVVRHDGHVAHAAVAMMVFAGTWLLLIPFRRWRGWKISAALLALCSVIGLNTFTYASAYSVEFKVEKFRLPSPDQAWSFAHRRWSELLQFLSEGEEPLRRKFQETKRAIAVNAALPTAGGYWDAFPDYAGILVMADKPYRPRPNFIGLNVYSPASAEMNAAFLRSPQAPDNIIFRYFTLDHKLATSEDNRVWPELLSRYDLVGSTKEFLLLRMAEPVRPYRIEPFMVSSVAWNETLQVDGPSGRMVWAEVDVRPSLLGRLVRFLFKLPEVFIDIKTNTGREIRHKIAASSSKGGFLLSPVIESDADTIAMYDQSGHPLRVAKGVVSISFSIMPTMYFLYENRIGVRLHWLDMKTQAKATNLLPEQLRLLRLNSMLAYAPTGRPIPVYIRTEPGMPVLFAHAPENIRVPVQPDVSHATVKFGMLPGTYAQPNLGDGVIFIVKGVRPNGAVEELWRRWLAPSNVAADQGEQQASFSFPEGRYSHLEFETNPGATQSFDASYWSDVVVR